MLTGSSGTLIGWKSGQPLMSLYGTAWRERGYALRSHQLILLRGSVNQTKPNSFIGSDRSAEPADEQRGGERTH